MRTGMAAFGAIDIDENILNVLSPKQQAQYIAQQARTQGVYLSGRLRDWLSRQSPVVKALLGVALVPLAPTIGTSLTTSGVTSFVANARDNARTVEEQQDTIADLAAAYTSATGVDPMTGQPIAGVAAPGARADLMEFMTPAGGVNWSNPLVLGGIGLGGFLLLRAIRR